MAALNFNNPSANATIMFATKTLDTINRLLEEDQGNAYRGFLQKVLPHIGDAYRQDDESQRTHLGASVLGKECARDIWYSFRWYTKKRFDGRILRLFNRGHLEEARFIALLLMIGCKVYQQDENGNQFRIKHAEGHMGGSGDGVVIGLPDLPSGTPALVEFKTHGEKSYLEVASKGVRDAKPEHYVQMQTYMAKMNLPIGLYGAVNKNTDALHLELVPLNIEVAMQFLNRGEKLVWMVGPPAKLNESPGFYKCRFCDHRPVCHLDAKPDKNCRTCKHVQPMTNGDWACNLHTKLLTKEEQAAACEDHTYL